MKRSDRPPMKHAEQVSSLLKQLLGQPGLGEQITRHQAWLIWDQLVGEQIASHARPLKLRKGVLEVQVDHPVWMQQLQMLKPQILQKITDKIPNAGITDIYLRQTRNRDASMPRKKVKSISNPELKDEMRNLFTRQKKVDKLRRES